MPEFMTRKDFIAKWGELGQYGVSNRNWFINTEGGINANGSSVLSARQEERFTAWDGFLTAVGCKPVDPREAVFKAYGWTSQPDTKQEFGKWIYTANGQQWFVYADGGTFHKAGRGSYENIEVNTAAQAEALCVLMGLTKVGGT